MRPWANWTALFGISGSFFFISGIFLCSFSNLAFDTIIKNELPLTPTSRSFEAWQSTRVLPIYMYIYFFNWTNPENFGDPRVKMKFEEVGPYVYRDVREKVDIEFHPENDTVSYDEVRYWYFDEGRSKGSLTDVIQHINAIVIAASHVSRYWTHFMQTALGAIVKSTNSQIYVTKTVEELLFTGYTDTLMEISKEVESEHKSPYDRFAWFYKKNGSIINGRKNAGTGLNDLNNLGVLKYWDYKDTIKHYKSPCNAVEGSTGEFWPPYRNKEDIILFNAEMCRPLTYEFVEEVTHKGINGYKFSLGKKTLSNNTMRCYPHEQAKYFEPTTTTEDFFEAEPATIRPEQLTGDPDMVNIGNCFCNGQCTPMGLINVSACHFGAPAFISLPHFHKADPVISEPFEGLNPDDEKHDFNIVLEPNTGIPIKVAARLQLNTLIKQSKTIELLSDPPTVFFPSLWFSLEVEIPDDMIVSLGYLLLIPKITFYTGILFILLGALGILACAIMYYRQKRIQPAKIFKARNVEVAFNANDKKTQVIYVDKTLNEDDQVRQNRQLYNKT